MSEKTTLTCDVCGKDRAEVNGWWSYRTDEREFHAGHADGKKGRFHACGHLCLHKALDAYLTSQAVTSPVPEPPQAEQEPTVKEEPESLVRGKGLNVADIVAEQGGKEPVFEGSKVVEFESGPKLVATYEPLPCEPGEEAKVPEPLVENKQIDIPFDEKENQPKEKE